VEGSLPNYLSVENLAKEIEVPKDATRSRVLHQGDKTKIVLIALAGGQELAQHTAAIPVTLQILQGDARVTLDGDEKEFSAGSWAFMEANLPHSVYARTDVIMLLTMLGGAQQK
jgi:quercetin dioxygenase-like cupin family protein